jgi:hypothetical protein
MRRGGVRELIKHLASESELTMSGRVRVRLLPRVRGTLRAHGSVPPAKCRWYTMLHSAAPYGNVIHGSAQPLADTVDLARTLCCRWAHLFQLTFRGYRRAAQAACPPGQTLRARPLPLPRRPRRCKRRERQPFCYLRCASRFSPQVRAPIPGLLPHQLLHTTLERASRGKHVRFLSTGSAPPPAQWRHQGPRKAGRLHVHSPHHSPTHRPTARVSRPPRSLIQHRQRVRRRSSAAHKARTCPASIRSTRIPRS